MAGLTQDVLQIGLGLARGTAFHAWRSATGRPRFQDLSDTLATYLLLCTPALGSTLLQLALSGNAAPLMWVITFAAAYAAALRLLGKSLLLAAAIMAWHGTWSLTSQIIDRISDSSALVTMALITVQILTLMRCIAAYQSLPETIHRPGYKPSQLRDPSP